MEQKNKFAKEYAENHVIVNHLTPEEYENTDAAIHNLQFMSYCAGWEKAIKEAIRVCEEWCNKDPLPDEGSRPFGEREAMQLLDYFKSWAGEATKERGESDE